MTQHLSRLNKLRLGLLVLRLSAAAALPSACSDATASPTVRAGSRERVVIAATRYIGACPVLAAQERGFFTQHGIDAEIRYEPSGRVALESVLAGRAQLATVSEVPIMFAAVSGKPVSVLATISVAARDHGVVAHAQSPAALRGKRIGVPLRTSVHFYLEALLNRHGMSARDVVLHDVTPDQALGAFVRGEVDAFAAWQPFLNEAADALHGDAHIFSGEDVYDVMYNLAADKNYVAGHTSALERVLAASIAGARFCEREPERAIQLLRGIANAETRHFEQLWPEYRFRVALDQGLLLAIEDETRWAMKHELTSAQHLPNYLSNIDFGPLQAVAPMLVTMIH